MRGGVDERVNLMSSNKATLKKYYSGSRSLLARIFSSTQTSRSHPAVMVQASGTLLIRGLVQGPLI